MVFGFFGEFRILNVRLSVYLIDSVESCDMFVANRGLAKSKTVFLQKCKQARVRRRFILAGYDKGSEPGGSPQTVLIIKDQ